MAASNLQQWLIKYIQTSTNQDNIASSFVDSDELESLLATVDQDARTDMIYTIRSPEDKTALDYAVELGQRDIVRVMLKGLDLDNQGRLLWISPYLSSFELPSWAVRGLNYLTAYTDIREYSILATISRQILLLSFGYTLSALNSSFGIPQEITKVCGLIELALVVLLLLFTIRRLFPITSCNLVDVAAVDWGMNFCGRLLYHVHVLQNSDTPSKDILHSHNEFIILISLILGILVVGVTCVYATPVFGVYLSYGLMSRSVSSENEPWTVQITTSLASKHVLTISYYSQALLFKALKKKDVWEEIFHALGKDGRSYLIGELYGLHPSPVIRSFRTILSSYHNLYQESVMIDGPEFSEQYKIDDQHALILYNTHNCHGASDEALVLSDALSAIGFKRMLREWNSTHELLSTMHEAAQALPSTASVMVVCVMSHGCQGSLTDREGVQIPVNYILHKLTQDLPDGIPLVLVVQACQGFASMPVLHEGDTDMAQRAGPATTEGQHISLRRPHTALLMATVAGGKAVRGVYTGALAKQLKKADGKTEIGQMHTNASNLVERMGHQQQIPEIQHTLRKLLLLPGKQATTKSESFS